LAARQKANASPPLLFEGRGVRPDFVPAFASEGMERREAHPNREPPAPAGGRGQRRLKADGRGCCEHPHASRRSISGDFSPWNRASGVGRRSSGPPDPAGFRQPSSGPVQPTEGRPLVIGADGEPGRPGRGGASPARRRRVEETASPVSIRPRADFSATRTGCSASRRL
jgi:hypothetical protein